MKLTAILTTKISPREVLDAAKTLPVADAHTCDLAGSWITGSEYLEWAKKHFARGDDADLLSSVVFAKRCVCRQIDTLLQNNFLSAANYVAKIDILRDAGIHVPQIIYDLGIEPRNEQEHAYERTTKKEAGHCVDVADLFLSATQAVAQRPAVVALNWNIQGHLVVQKSGTSESLTYNFKGFRDECMIFVDVFAEPKTVKLVEPSGIRLAEMKAFTRPERIELSQLLRSHHESNSRSSSGYSANVYPVIKLGCGL